MKSIKLFSIAVVCVLGMTTNSFAQISFGAYGGANFAKITNVGTSSVSVGSSSSSVKNGFKVLPHLGGYVEVAISDYVSFQPELLFTMKGYTTKSEYTYTSTYYANSTASGTFSYIDVPLLLRINFNESLYASFGPDVAFLLAVKGKYKSEVVNGSSTVTSESESTDKDGIKTVDVGVYVGLGYRLENGLFFNLRWNPSLTPFNEDPGTSSIYVRNTHSVFQLSVGFSVGK